MIAKKRKNGTFFSNYEPDITHTIIPLADHKTEPNYEECIEEDNYSVNSKENDFNENQNSSKSNQIQPLSTNHNATESNSDLNIHRTLIPSTNQSKPFLSNQISESNTEPDQPQYDGKMKRPSLNIELERKLFQRDDPKYLPIPEEGHRSRRHSETPRIVFTPAANTQSNYLQLPDLENLNPEEAEENLDENNLDSEPQRKSSLSVNSAKSRSRSGSVTSHHSSDSNASNKPKKSDASITKIGRERRRRNSAYAASHSETGLDPSYNTMLNSPFLGAKTNRRKDENRRKNESEASTFRRKKSHSKDER